MNKRGRKTSKKPWILLDGRHILKAFTSEKEATDFKNLLISNRFRVAMRDETPKR